MVKNISKGDKNSVHQLKDSIMTPIPGMIEALFWRYFDPGQPEMAQIT